MLVKWQDVMPGQDEQSSLKGPHMTLTKKIIEVKVFRRSLTIEIIF